MHTPAATTDLAFLTPDVPGVGGRIRVRIEDFRVDERPLTEPCGGGEHVWLYVEKCNQTTLEAAHRIARLFGVRASAVGFAGLKDKRAVCRQVFSVHLPGEGIPRVACGRFVHTPMTLLWADRHTRKLRRGHHGGNRFVIRIRDVDAAAAEVAGQVLDRLAARGVPNYIGPQRFGFRQNNHVMGRLLLAGDYQGLLDEMLGRPRDFETPRMHAARLLYEAGDFAAALEAWPPRSRHDRQALDALRRGRSAEAAVLAIDRQQRSFMLSSLQSAVFNRVLDRRLRAGCFDRLVAGDLAWKHDSRAVFAVDDVTADLENAAAGRVGSQQVSPSGPMWGPKMPRPTGAALAWECAALAELGMTAAAWEAGLARLGRGGGSSVEAEGERRPLRVPLRDPRVAAGSDEHGAFIELAFELPRGSFATAVLREVMKVESTEAERGA
jgi:tRNA pseudouridine13 synthase